METSREDFGREVRAPNTCRGLEQAEGGGTQNVSFDEHRCGWGLLGAGPHPP
jgi:hypothetical protein